MKKTVKILGVICALLLFSGCMKYDIDMTINSDKSMDLKYINAYSKELLESLSQNNQGGNLLDESKFEESKKEGYEVSNYEDDKFKGFEIKKHFNSIDEVSTEEDIDVDLNSNEGGKKFFKIIKDGNKIRYKAKYKTSEASSLAGQGDSYKDNEEYSKYFENMEFKFILNLPTKAISNNANTVSNDGKKLEWDLLNLQNGTIEFEFELQSSSNLVLIIGIVAGALVLIGVCVFIFINKNKSNKKTVDDIDIEIV